LTSIIIAEKPRESPVDNSSLERIRDPEIIENYLTDESRIIWGKAEEVVYPKSEAQVAKILREANKRKIHVTISGAGTGITGSRVPPDGIVLSTEKLTQINVENLPSGELIEHSELGKKYFIFIGKDRKANEFYAIAPPGIPIETFKKIVENKGLYYPPDPTETTAFLGGTVATNASGARTFRYGPTRNYVRRIRIVLPNGDVLNIKRGRFFAENNKFTIILTNRSRVNIKLPTYTMPKVEKNAAGYYVKSGMDLIDLFIGSEGTLGMISEIEVRLTKKPGAIIPIFAHFPEEKEAIKFVKKLKNASIFGKLSILSIEFFDKYSTDFIRQKYPPPKIPEKSNGIIFFEQEAQNEDELFNTLEETMKLLEKSNVLETAVFIRPTWQKEAKEIRHALPEGINNFVHSHGTHKVATDIAVPEENLDEMIQYYHKVGNETAIPYVIFGHIGNSHLHFNFLPTNQKELENAVKACTMLLKKAVQLGGTVSGEHGVGKKHFIENGNKKPYLELMYGKRGLMEIARLKHALDPNHILNIGNIVPKQYLQRFC